MFLNKKLIALSLLAIFTVAIFSEEEEYGDVAKLSDKDIVEFGIVVEPISGGVVATEIELNGEISVNEEKVTHISSRFDGIIKNIYSQVGDYVSRGKILAIIENSNNLTSYKVIASRSGIITFKDAALGEIAPAGQDLFQITNLSTVWAKLSVYQKDIQVLKKGQKLLIKDPFSSVETEGVIDYISPLMSEVSRTITARVTLANRGGTWRPGMFISATVAIDSTDADIRAPLSAIHQFEGNNVIFVQDEDGFEPKSVKLGKKNQHFVEILSGVEIGDPIVTKNGFVIKSELGKFEMGEGHGH